MKVHELFASFRDEIDDTQVPHLWPDPTLYLYLNEAEREAARRARLLTDATTAAICEIAVTTADPVLTLDRRVLFVRRIKLASQNCPLVKVRLEDIERWAPEWETATGDVTHYVPNWQTGKLRLYRIPEADDTAKLIVCRLPLSDMLTEADEPEIALQAHQGLVHWMLWRAFSKKDTETYNRDEAKRNLDIFELEFGQKSRVIDERWNHTHHGYDDFEGLY